MPASRPPTRAHILAALTLAATFATARSEIHIDPVMTRDGPARGTINDIVQDRTGYLWFATTNGLLRYDGYTFKAHRSNPSNANSISGNHIWSVCEDNAGHLWVGTSGRGVSRYIPKEDRFVRYRHDPNDSTTVEFDEEVPSVFLDQKGNLWFALWEGGIDRFVDEKRGFVHRDILTVDPDGVPRSNVHRIGEDQSGRLWIGTRAGLYRLDPSNDELTLYQADTTDPHSIGGNYVESIVTDPNGRLWIATRGGGVSMYRPDSDDFDVFRHDPNDANSLSTDIASALCADSTGFLWVGTDGGGLCRIDPRTRSVERLSKTGQGPLTQSTGYISALYTDREGAVWIGTADEGLHRYHPAARKFRHIRARDGGLGDANVTAILEASDSSLWVGTTVAGLHRWRQEDGGFDRFVWAREKPGSISDNHVSGIAEDDHGGMWVATYGGGLNAFDPHTEQFEHFRHDPNDAGSLVSDLINVMTIDNTGRIWLGTDGGGISILDPEPRVFENRTIDENDPLYSSRHVWEITQARDGTIWIGMWGSGMNRYDPRTRQVTHYVSDPENPASISSNIIVVIVEDGAGNMWLGTWSEGLNRLDPTTGEMTHFTTASGLPSDNIFGIVPDAFGQIWVSTGDGLARYDPEMDTWRVYGIHDGLQSSEFRRGAFHAGRSGRIYFGGINGLNVFRPEEVKDNAHIPPIVLTSLVFRGREMAPRAASLSTGNKALKLPHNDNTFTVEFAALDYTHPPGNRYAYKLDGVDADWIDSGTRRVASYSHLSPGKYTLCVKGTNQDGIWNENGVAVQFTITPPLWKTWWAYVLYALVIVAIVGALRQRELTRMRLASALRIERFEAEKLRELDETKSRFFANISHEFRTPLALILGPLDRLKKRLSETSDADVDMMRRNAHRLLRLIDQILDLSKLEAASMTLNVKDADLRDVARTCAAAFTSFAGSHGIDLHLHLPEHPVGARFDREQMEKCINNLISNAIKFTPAGGAVTLTVRASSDDRGKSLATIAVTDTGVGIKRADLDRIFDRFYQAHDDGAQRGTGIGLALTKELVSQHGGDISVESERDAGTTFTIHLPLVAPEEADLLADSESHAVAIDAPDPDAPLVLVIEDTADMRAYIRTVLSEEVRVIEAPDGEIGLRMGVEHLPELVVCDLMMPGIDGFEVCRRLKTDARTSHIPVVMLTARAGEENRVEGLEVGADDYLSKPFSAAELRARVRNLIRSRRELRERFGREVTLMPADVTITPADANFVEHLMTIVNKNLADPDFSVEAFAAAVGMSRMHLHRKIRALTDQTTGQFVRTLRLRTAAELLRSGGHTVTEVAFAVGFRNSNYFSKCFREEFDTTPSEYVTQQS